MGVTDPVTRRRCYIASPLGFTVAGRRYYDEVYLPALRTVVEPEDPWSLTSEEEVRKAREEGRDYEIAMKIGERNAKAIADSDLLVAYLEGQEVDAGTVVEVGYAAALGLPCFGLRTDFRQAGEPGVRVNLQVQWIIEASGGRICESLEELLAAIVLAPPRGEPGPLTA